MCEQAGAERPYPDSPSGSINQTANRAKNYEHERRHSLRSMTLQDPRARFSVIMNAGSVSVRQDHLTLSELIDTLCVPREHHCTIEVNVPK